MLLKRTLVSFILLPLGLAAIFLGGPVYLATIVFILLLAAWEYLQLFRAGGLQPAGALVYTGTIMFVAGRALDGFQSAPLLLTLLILASMAYHMWKYERGRDQAASDFAISLSGALYLGWIGAYLVSLRDLPNGLWWVLLALPAVWFADSAAYLVGVRFGRHKLNRRLSPKKSWEGYIGGIVFGTLGTAALAWAYQMWVIPNSGITPARGALLGVAVTGLSLLGDLGESMIKRQVGAKDSSHIIPGHGGVFDRIDSWLWAGVISYYLVVWLFP